MPSALLINNIIEVTKQARGYYHPGMKKYFTGFVIGRKFFTHWHCGRRMIQVKTFIDGGRGLDEAVCPVCFHHYEIAAPDESFES